MDRCGPWHHRWSYHLWDWIDLSIGIHPQPGNLWILVNSHSNECRVFFSQNNKFLEFGGHLCDLQIVEFNIDSELTNPGYPKYEPVMFDLIHVQFTFICGLCVCKQQQQLYPSRARNKNKYMKHQSGNLIPDT